MTRSICLSALTLAAGLALPGRAAGQQREHAASGLGLAIGIADFHQRDEYVSPVTFRAAIVAANALFEKRSTRMLHSIEASFSVGHPNSATLPRDDQQRVGRLAYSLLRALGDPERRDGRLVLFLGGGLSTFGEVTVLDASDATWNYTYRDWSWYWAHSVDLAARLEYAAAARSAAVRLATPAVRLVSRPNNGKDFNAGNERVSREWLRGLAGGKLTYPWNGPMLVGETDYRQRMSARLQLRAAYDFTYASSDRPRALAMYMHQLLVGFLWLP